MNSFSSAISGALKALPGTLRALPSLFCALALFSCIGQVDDEEPVPPVPGGETADAASGGLVLDFTATWCVNCPRMSVAIEEAMAERPGAIVPLCIHFQDAMICDDGKDLISRFGIQAYPSAVMNMDASTLTTATSKELILAKLDDTAARLTSSCDLTAEVSSATAFDVTVNLTSATASSYRVSVALVQDGVTAPQTGGADDYIHNNIFRGFLQTDPLGDLVENLTPGETRSISFNGNETALPKESCKIVVFVTEPESGLVVKAISKNL